MARLEGDLYAVNFEITDGGRKHLEEMTQHQRHMGIKGNLIQCQDFGVLKVLSLSFNNVVHTVCLCRQILAMRFDASIH